MKFFDLHCDTLTKCMDNSENLFKNNMHNSLSALLGFDTPCQVFAIYTDDKNVYHSYEYAKKAAGFFARQKKEYAGYMTDMSTRPDKNKVNAILSIEGCEPVESLEAIDEFYSLGVRLMTLTWNRVNSLGSGMLSGSEEGLTPFGKEAVRHMNKLNITVDVSHLNIRGFEDVAAISEKPFIASHSNCFEICPHPRNLHDWQIKEINRAGGIIGLNLYPPFVAQKDCVSINDLLAHTEHFLKLGCEDTLCLGCDFDGISSMPKELKGTADMGMVYALFKENFGNIADKIFFDNAFKFFLRFL